MVLNLSILKWHMFQIWPLIGTKDKKEYSSKIKIHFLRMRCHTVEAFLPVGLATAENLPKPVFGFNEAEESPIENDCPQWKSTLQSLGGDRIKTPTI
ncbi:hypothetical protein CWR48_00800 [Oceanobacillus arenosus]|uniref:Uncharacterized protein n=1 Tax=Oceanobacillus arenosus TaxID=1229153 RepID=A0A3D8Q382_9BACI|nr:hypothetical protein CWR48_00800 [Oceanobacillus arenosus]